MWQCAHITQLLLGNYTKTFLLFFLAAMAVYTEVIIAENLAIIKSNSSKIICKFQKVLL